MKLKKYIAISCLSLSLLGTYQVLASPQTVLAETQTKQNSFTGDNTDATASAYVDDPAAISLFSQVAKDSNQYANANILSVDVGKRVIYFDNNVYQGLYINQRKDFLKYALKSIKDSNLKPKSKNKLYNFLSLQDGDASKILRSLEKDLAADIASGREVYLPFNGPITTTLGLIALGVFIGVGLTIVLDIAYLTLPMVYKAIENNPEGRLPKFISQQAYFVAKQRDEGTVQNYMLSYLAKRSIAVGLVMIALGYLSSGLIFEVVGNIVQVFSEAFRN